MSCHVGQAMKSACREGQSRDTQLHSWQSWRESQRQLTKGGADQEDKVFQAQHDRGRCDSVQRNIEHCLQHCHCCLPASIRLQRPQMLTGILPAESAPSGPCYTSTCAYLLPFRRLADEELWVRDESSCQGHADCCLRLALGRRRGGQCSGAARGSR